MVHIFMESQPGRAVENLITYFSFHFMNEMNEL